MVVVVETPLNYARFARRMKDGRRASERTFEWTDATVAEFIKRHNRVVLAVLPACLPSDPLLSGFFY